MKTLIVDDREDSRYLLEVLLKGNSHDVETAVNGAEALEKLKIEKIDLIISDILMPVMDGFQLCRQVKSDENLKHIPFIIYTATYTGPQDEAFAVKIGADRFIIKPCEPDLFMEAVQEVMTAAKILNSNSKTIPLHEEEMLKLYNERLVRKLEQKMLQLEKEVKMRQNTEEELRKTNSFLDSIFENIPDMIFLKDAGDLRFIRFNKAGEDILGYSKNELIGKSDYDLFPKEQADFFTENDRKTISRKEIVDIPEEIVQTRHKGTRIMHTKKVPLMDEKGEPLYLLGIAEDITGLKQTEAERNKLNAQLQQAQKLESLGNLAGGIAHDFNNILSVIIGFTEIALFDVEKDSKVKESLQEVFKASMRAKDLVKQILTFARRSDDEIKPVKVKSIVKEVLDFLRSSIPTTIQIKQNIQSDSSIMGNPTQLHQVFMNLCTNAAYAMEEEGGILEIGLEDIRFDRPKFIRGQFIKPGEYIVLKVSDTGAGISLDVIGSIFEPYYTTKTPGEGTGLGLALVHSIVDSYGGKVDVESTLGKGSVFSIYIPTTNKIKAYLPYKKEDLPTGSEKILFVDDEDSIAKVGSQIINQLGYSVTIQTSSNQALELFKQNPYNYDLVITDTTMPQMTGDKFAIELMKIRPDIPVILCTGYSKKISEENMRQIGVKGLLYKPFIKADLAKILRKVLDEVKLVTKG
ncbi:MAG: response regulator [Deltaproteobacteria bacterium]|nr:response regulator [Deltaproteobacteria bacterium]